MKREREGWKYPRNLDESSGQLPPSAVSLRRGIRRVRLWIVIFSTSSNRRWRCSAPPADKGGRVNLYRPFSFFFITRLSPLMVGLLTRLVVLLAWWAGGSVFGVTVVAGVERGGLRWEFGLKWAVGSLRAVEVCFYRWRCCWRGLTGERDCRFSWQGKKGLLVWRLRWR